MPTMLISFCLEGKRFGYAVIASTITLVVGSILAAPQKEDGAATSILGVALACASMLAAALKPVLVVLIMQDSVERPKLAPPVVLFYESCIAFCCMLLYYKGRSRERELG